MSNDPAQFDDAPEAEEPYLAQPVPSTPATRLAEPAPTAPEQGYAAAREPGAGYIDEDEENVPEAERLESGTGPEAREAGLEDEAEHEEDGYHGSDWDENDDWEGGEEIDEVNDQDWEGAGKDFTKQYNRLRQQVHATRTPAPAASTSSHTPSSATPLPATNRPRRPPPPPTSAAVSTAAIAAKKEHADQLTRLTALFANQINLAPYTKEKTREKDKSDRATTEQVLDDRTRLILLKMVNRGVVAQVNGCLSTGKEANVYHAAAPQLDPSIPATSLALKIYKTSILIFKDRDRYVTGEFRFRRGYAKSNPRKMVRLWAEKEMRNLKRMWEKGMRCPQPIEVRENVLCMEFFGTPDGWASPRLKDAAIPSSKLPGLYAELVCAVRMMYRACRLVHADLSEYNILYHASHLYIIDVSQSVEHDHPAAFDFLRSDLRNVESFFAKQGVHTLGLRRTFDFVVAESLREGGERRAPGEVEPDEEMEAVLAEWLAAPAPVEQDAKDEAKKDDAVFFSSYIPRTLNEVYDPERDVDRIKRGEGKDLIYAGVTGVAEVNKGEEDEVLENGKTGKTVRVVEEQRLAAEEDAESEGEEEDGEEDVEDEESEEDDEDGRKPRGPKGKKFEDKDAKKGRKAAAKEEARERRKHKIPKAEKKRKIKTSRGGR